MLPLKDLLNPTNEDVSVYGDEGDVRFIIGELRNEKVCVIFAISFIAG